jgi:putative ABC transport system permease protein
MDAIESLRLSWRAIRGHKLRSTLTTLGVVIGVAAVITFVTLGASLSTAIIGEVSADQPPEIAVWAGPEAAVDSGQGGPGFGAQPVLTAHDLDRLAELDDVESVMPLGRVSTTALTHEGDSVAADSIIATTPPYLADEAFAAGDNFEMGTRTGVLNPAAATQFETNVTVGDTVTVTLANGSTTTVEVVGILNTSQSTGPFEGFGTTPRVYVPTEPYYATFVESPTQGEIQRVYATATILASGHEALEDVQADARTYLDGDSDASELLPRGYAFAAQTNEQLLAQIQSILDQLTGFVTGIALISLLVGAIGIANIMLVSVTERTREIGIMKAVGARRRDVLQLFLVEATVLGLAGSILGTGLGFLGGYAVTAFLEFPTTFPLEWVPIAIVVGIAVGVFAGLYPAWNAARIDPIDALRYE